MSVVIDGTTGISGNDGSAATPALRGDDANTGVFFPAADTVAVATGGSERFRIGPAGQIGLAGANYGSVNNILVSQGPAATAFWGTINGLMNASGSAPVYACRAWVNFNGTGAVAIRASGNVTSITDNGVGDYTVNFTIAMPDANYCWSASGQQPAGSTSTAVIGSSSAAPTASALRLLAVNAGAAADFPHVCVAIFR